VNSALNWVFYVAMNRELSQAFTRSRSSGRFSSTSRGGTGGGGGGGESGGGWSNPATRLLSVWLIDLLIDLD
jgi:hypothetical protein